LEKESELSTYDTCNRVIWYFKIWGNVWHEKL